MTDDVGDRRRLLLLVWDAPNMDMTLANLLGGRPTSRTRPRFDVVGRWLVRRGHALDARAEAALFINVPPDSAASIAPFVHAVRSFGFAVFARPKIDGLGDIDDDMLEHLRARHAQGQLAEVIVASHDGQAFLDQLRQMSAAGVRTTVLGFEEYASWTGTDDGIRFIDLEAIEGTFESPLNRVSIQRLPPEGAWLGPLRDLELLVES